MRSIFEALFIVGLITGLITSPVFGQFNDLATTGDGEQLYFSSPLRLKGTDQFATPKIFRYNFGVFELYRQVQRQLDPFDGPKTNQYRLIAPEVSEDGQAVSFTSKAECNAGSGCIAFTFTTGEVDI